MRFSLSQLFLAVTIIALACAGMLARERWLTDCIFSLTIVLYVACALRALRLDGLKRWRAMGFATIGGGYLLLATLNHARESLLTNNPLAMAAMALQLRGSYVARPGPGPGPGGFGFFPSLEETLNSAYGGNPDFLELHRFFFVGHCAMSLLFALLGAWACGAIYTKRQKSAQAEERRKSPTSE
jgi:hypothetical protein